MAELQHEALSRSWTSRNEFPLISDWITANTIPLQHVVSASECRQLWYPLISPPSRSLVDANETFLQWTRVAHRLLAVRAMQGAANGDINGAVSDLLALIRLGRLSRHRATTHSILFGSIYELAGYYGFEILIEGNMLSDQQASDCLKVIISEELSNPLEHEKNVLNRIMSIDALQSLVFDDNGEIEADNQLTALSRFNSRGELQSYVRDHVDLAAAQDEIHVWMDRAVNILRLSEVTARRQQFAALEESLIRITKSASTDLRDSTDPEKPGRALGALMVYQTLQKNLIDLDRVVRTENAIIGTSLALILAAFDGRDLSKVQDLVPDYLPKTPVDLDSGLPLSMKHSEGTFRIWSSGLRADGKTPMRFQFRLKENVASNSSLNKAKDATAQSSIRVETDSLGAGRRVVWITCGVSICAIAIGFMFLKSRLQNRS
jgi:hypothetical protein